MIMVPILLLNMLIAMMGNTYAQVIERSEKEWVKQWAKIVIALERAVNQEHAKEYLVSYSIKISDATDGSDGSPPQEQIRGVMVIKSKENFYALLQGISKFFLHRQEQDESKAKEGSSEQLEGNR